MGKAKRTGGLSGVSRFVFESMQSNSDTAKTSSETTLISDRATLNAEEIRPLKRRKANDGTSIPDEAEVVEIKWVKKYDATGLVPHYTHSSQVPEHLHKYFSQRERYFSLYSTPPGCLLDEEGWYSVTPELLANQIADRCRCDTILDAFCGVGGNAIAFAQTCQRVIALDTSPTRLALARHNAQIYGVADRIEFVLTDYLSFADSYLSLPSLAQTGLDNSHKSRKIDVVFLSPPWGGPSYLSGSGHDIAARDKEQNSTPIPEHPSYSLSSIQPVHGASLFDLTRKITNNVAYYLPRNTRLDEIAALLSEETNRTNASLVSMDSKTSEEEKVEVEEEWMGNKLKALTCYFGGLAAGQEGMF